MSSAPLYRPRCRTIGLTALIDVIFILLLFFMLSSTFVQWRAIDLQFPGAREDDDARPPQIVLLRETGHLKLYGSEAPAAHYGVLTPDDLTALEPERPLVMLPARNTNVQTIIATLERVKSLGRRMTLGPSFEEEPE